MHNLLSDVSNVAAVHECLTAYGMASAVQYQTSLRAAQVPSAIIMPRVLLDTVASENQDIRSECPTEDIYNNEARSSYTRRDQIHRTMRRDVECNY